MHVWLSRLSLRDCACDVFYPVVIGPSSSSIPGCDEGDARSGWRSKRYLPFPPLANLTRRVLTTSAASVDVECPARFRIVLSEASVLSSGPCEWKCAAYIARESLSISSTRAESAPRCSRNEDKAIQAQRKSPAVFVLTPSASITRSICTSVAEGGGLELANDDESTMLPVEM
jgi:hypothetical protein